MKHTALLLLGSNIEPRRDYLERALMLLSGKIMTLKRSSTYETAAWGMEKGTHSFFNLVIKATTELTPEELLAHCINCETELGRVRTGQVAPRTIDIDILLYDDEIIQSEGLTIPHPRLHLRRFTLVPLAEIAPEVIHPVLKKSISELLAECSDASEVKLV